MHMISKKDLNSAELETVTASRSPTTVITASGEVQTNEEATVNVKELEKFLTMKVLEDTPAVLSQGKLCNEHGHSYEWISGQKPHLIRNGKRIDCNIPTMYHLWFLVSSEFSSTTLSLTSPSSSSQDSIFDVNRYTDNPVPERSRSTSGELWGDPLHETKRIRKPK